MPGTQGWQVAGTRIQAGCLLAPPNPHILPLRLADTDPEFCAWHCAVLCMCYLSPLGRKRQSPRLWFSPVAFHKAHSALRMPCFHEPYCPGLFHFHPDFTGQDWTVPCPPVMFSLNHPHTGGLRSGSATASGDRNTPHPPHP